MHFSLIICTYMRPMALLNLLNSVDVQTVYPTQILIIDGSINNETEQILKEHSFNNLNYYKVEEHDRGLTKQRNYGILKIDKLSELVCFLDDDTQLNVNYFEHLLNTYEEYPKALGVGGYITNEVQWKKNDGSNSAKYFYFDGSMRHEPLRFRVRKMFGLAPDSPPCYLPTFSHGRSVGFLPPSGKIYPVEQFMGGVSSYRTSVFKSMHFSTYFEGYGLYEDADFCLRLAKKGELYVNTAAQLAHYHDPQGRPNKFRYGKMVIRNGWYIWRVKYPKPNLAARLKWHLTAGLLMSLTLFGCFTARDKKAAIVESFGRFYGWLSLWIYNPKIEA